MRLKVDHNATHLLFPLFHSLTSPTHEKKITLEDPTQKPELAPGD